MNYHPENKAVFVSKENSLSKVYFQVCQNMFGICGRNYIIVSDLQILRINMSISYILLSSFCAFPKEGSTLPWVCKNEDLVVN